MCAVKVDDNQLIFGQPDTAPQPDLTASELEKLLTITSRINAGFTLDEILEGLYREFRDVIPYNRIGVALLSEDGLTLRTRWVRSDQPLIYLGDGFGAILRGSSLETVLHSGRPRIINDLVAYLQAKPASTSTRLILEEGMRSSLTCPLIAKGKPIGFLFFSSIEVGAYAQAHVDFYRQIAGQVAVMVEKGMLVSLLEKQNQTIENRNLRLREVNRLKNTILGIAAHDLRNPLSYIHTTVGILTGPDAETYADSRDELLAGIGRQTSHMLNLIDDLLDITEIEAGRLTLHFRPVDVETFFKEIVVLQRSLAKAKGTRIDLRIDRGGVLNADPDRLRQVLDNLISNAVKYSPRGSTIRVNAALVEQGYRVDVIDQGPGILPEERGKLFLAFSKLSSQPTAGERTTGLGLAISQWIIKHHDGEIGVVSEPGRGSDFWFVLPEKLYEPIQ